MAAKKDNSRSVEKTIEIAAPIAAVWKALTEADELQRWFQLEAGATPGVGGIIRLKWRDKFEWLLKIEVAVTEKHLRLTYNHDSDFTAKDADKVNVSGMLAIDYFLEGHGGKTTVRLVHSGFGHGANWDEEYDSVRRGWISELGNLKHYLENHPGEDRQVAWATTQLNEPIESAWKKLMSTEGLLKSGSLANLKEGDNYDFTSAIGDSFQGNVCFFNPTKDFMVTVANLNNAGLRIYLEEYRGLRYVTIWLSAYGLPKSQVEDFEKRYNELLKKLFGTKA